MTIKTQLTLVLISFTLTLLTTGCAREPSEFEMPVDQVDELKGFILKGISISGEIARGCITNDDPFVVTRDGEEVLSMPTRILNVRDLKDAESFDGEATEGDYVTLYIPDGSLQDVEAGDKVISNATSCGGASAERASAFRGTMNAPTEADER